MAKLQIDKRSAEIEAEIGLGPEFERISGARGSDNGMRLGERLGIGALERAKHTGYEPAGSG
jgi:hypothetical protein